MAIEAQIRANQATAQKPNPPKHGLAGAGVVLPEAEASEVERRTTSYSEVLKPANEVESMLVRHAALSAVRMERSAMIESVMLIDRICRAAAGFVAPEGVDAATAARMRQDACVMAMTDTSKEGLLSRKYEAAAERSLFRALKELRQLRREMRASEPKVEEKVVREELGSFSPTIVSNEEFLARVEKYIAGNPMMADFMPRRGASAPKSPPFPTTGGSFDIPFAIGKPR